METLFPWENLQRQPETAKPQGCVAVRGARILNDSLKCDHGLHLSSSYSEPVIYLSYFVFNVENCYDVLMDIIANSRETWTIRYGACYCLWIYFSADYKIW